MSNSLAQTAALQSPADPGPRAHRGAAPGGGQRRCSPPPTPGPALTEERRRVEVLCSGGPVVALGGGTTVKGRPALSKKNTGILKGVEALENRTFPTKSCTPEPVAGVRAGLGVTRGGRLKDEIQG
ncbi:unnamed protein product [Gadus morhua 'NCC']